MKKILISIIIFSFLLCGCQKTTPLSHKEFCLDTIVQITLYDSSSKNILNTVSIYARSMNLSFQQIIKKVNSIKSIMLITN